MYFLSAHRTIKAGNYFSSLFPAAHWLPSPHVIVFTQKYGADQCAGAFFSPCFFSPSPTPFSLLIPATCVFLGVRNSGPKARVSPSGRLLSHQGTPLAHVHSSAAASPLLGGCFNGVKMPVPEARVPGPPGLPWAREPYRGGEAAEVGGGTIS